MPRPNSGPRLKWLARRGGYYILWYDQGRERLRATGCTDRGGAERMLAAFIGQSHAATRPAGPADPRDFQVSAALALYGQDHAPHTADPERIGYAISALLPFWAGRPVSDISPATCNDYVKARARKAGTVRRELTVLRAALNHAVKHGHLRNAPTVALPAKPDGKDRWLTINEASRLLGAARTARADVRLYLPLFILIALYTGARAEAILSLKWSQIDLAGERINFAKPGAAKTNKGRARLPIPKRLLRFLCYAWARRSSDIGPVIHDSGRAIADIGGGWEAGKPPNGSFGSACKRAGLEGVTPHTLRHTRGTWSAQAGVDLWQIAGWLGQSLASTTEQYAHHHPDFMAAALNAADRRRA